MSLATLPDLVIARLRAQCPLLGPRVAGTSAEARAAENDQLPLPHAFFLPGGVEPGEGDELSPVDQHMHARFSVQVCVDNRADDRGQDGSVRLYAAAAQVVRALVGWTPSAPAFSPVICEGMPDDFASDRARLWGAVTFRTSIMSSDL